MIKHIVMFSLQEEARGKSKQENAVLLKQKLEALKEKIPVIRNLEVGINHPEAQANNHDLVLYIEFDTMADLYQYQQHPAHLEVVDFIRTVRIGKSAVDYEAES